MAMMQTPTGQVIFVPDDFNGMMPPQASVPEYPMPGAPNLPAPPPPPPPPPQTIGPGMPPVEETAGPVPQAAPPQSVLDQMGAPPIPVPGGQEIPVQRPTDAALRQQSAATAKAERQRQQQAAQQAAFANTTEGKIQGAGEEQAQAVEDQRTTAQKQGDLEAAQLANVAEIKRQGLTETDKERAAGATLMEQRAVGMAQKNESINKLVKANLDYKIDDNRRWHNLSTGRKILAGIGVALSGLGDALARRSGPNAAMQIIQGAIHDDVEAQVRERENLGKQIGFARNSLDDYQRETGTLLDAHKLKLSEEHDKVADQVDVTASMFGSPAAKLRGEMISAELRKTAAGLRAQTAESVFNRDLQRQTMANQRQQTAIAGGHLALAGRTQAFNERMQTAELLLKTQAQIDAEAKAVKAAQDTTGGIGGDVRTVVGKDGKPTTTVDVLRQPDGSVFKLDKEMKEEYGKLIAERTGVQGLYDTLGQIAEWRSKYGGVNAKTSPAAQAEYDRLTNKAIIAYATSKHISLADEQSQKFARDAILGSDPSAYNISDVDERVKRTLMEETNQYHAHLQGVGYQGKLPEFVNVNSAPKAGLGADDVQLKSLIKGDLPKNAKIQTLQSLGAMAQSQDPKVSGPALTNLDEIAKSATDSDTRDTAKGFAGYARAQANPTAGPGPAVAQPVQPTAPPTSAPEPVAGGSQYAAPATKVRVKPSILGPSPIDPNQLLVLMPDGTKQTLTLQDANKLLQTAK